MNNLPQFTADKIKKSNFAQKLKEKTGKSKLSPRFAAIPARLKAKEKERAPTTQRMRCKSKKTQKKANLAQKLKGKTGKIKHLPRFSSCGRVSA